MEFGFRIVRELPVSITTLLPLWSVILRLFFFDLRIKLFELWVTLHKGVVDPKLRFRISISHFPWRGHSYSKRRFTEVEALFQGKVGYTLNCVGYLAFFEYCFEIEIWIHLCNRLKTSEYLWKVHWTIVRSSLFIQQFSKCLNLLHRWENISLG